jgi:hypothetical protein
MKLNGLNIGDEKHRIFWKVLESMCDLIGAYIANFEALRGFGGRIRGGGDRE